MLDNKQSNLINKKELFIATEAPPNSIISHIKSISSPTFRV